MGNNPLSPRPLPTALERTRASYVRRDGISLETFEERVSYLLENGLAHVRTPMSWEAPPKRDDARSSAVPR